MYGFWDMETIEIYTEMIKSVAAILKNSPNFILFGFTMLKVI